MSSVGSQLRSARERLQLSVRDVANSTNIKSDHIRAMEAGDWKVFSAPVYVKGFVRTYAHHLKADASAILQALERELAAAGSGSDEDPLSAGSAHGPVDFLMLQFSRVPWALVFPLILGIAVILASVYGYRAWSTRDRRDPMADLGSPLYGTRAPVGAAALPFPTNAPVPARDGR